MLLMCGLSRAVPDRGRAESLYRLHPGGPASWQDVWVLSSDPLHLTRRRFLALSSGLAGLAVATGCGVPAIEDTPDPVLELIRAAERDARDFAAADASHGAHRDAILRIADVRRVHAERLAELVEPSAEPDVPESTPAAETEADLACPPVDEVRSRLRADAGGAAEVAAASEGIRAELTGAVSAACTAAVEVLLS